MRRALLGLAGAAVLVTAAPAAAAPTIYAHRGGPILNGRPVYPEETLAAFTASAKQGFALELDTHLTKDGVPIVIHDGTFDRTTTCTGSINAMTLAQVRKSCRADVLGLADDKTVPFKRTSKRWPVATLAQVLQVARKHRVAVDVEINDYPQNPDWDATDAFARKVVKALRASKLPKSKIIVQSFLPTWLDAAKAAWPGVATAVLSFQSGNGAALDNAIGKYRWVSPEWPLDAAYVEKAHGAGLRIVPFTIDDAAQVTAAGKAGVDALITNDPVMARRALR